MDDASIRQICQQYNLNVTEILPIKTGKFNSSYILNLPEDSGYPHNKVILRIAPADTIGYIFYEENMMAREADIHKKVKEHTSIPVPEIYHFDNSRSIINRNFILMELIPGKPLSNTPLSGEKNASIMRKTGEYLKELHDKCQSTTYGYPGLMENISSWPEAFTNQWENLIDDISFCNVYSFAEAQQVKKALQSQIKHFDHLKKGSLLHMDIWSQNIMIDYQGNLAAIIDWDRALWGDPEIEFAVLDYCGFNNAAFWQGYGGEPPNDEAARIRRTFYHFYEVQKYLVIWSLRRPDPVGVGSYKKYALDTLRKYL